MGSRLFDKGREAIAGAINLSTDAIRAMLVKLDGTATDTAVKAITGATNASPIVVTSNSHGFAAGDIVSIRGVLGNLAANGTYKVANPLTNTFELQTIDGQNTTGSGVYSSGGCAIDLTLADFRDDVDACLVGTVSGAFTTKTITNGVFDADDPTFTAVPNGTTSHAALVYRDVGTAATDNLISYHDGTHTVIVAAAAAGAATSIAVEPLEGDIASGTALVFSNGVTATLSAPATAGARSLSVSALASGIGAGHQADAPHNTTPNFPISGNGGNITLGISAGANKLFKI